MGNRAIITTKKRDLGVYLHWNGGRDSVGAFLEYCELRGFRAPDGDTYGWGEALPGHLQLHGRRGALRGYLALRGRRAHGPR